MTTVPGPNKETEDLLSEVELIICLIKCMQDTIHINLNQKSVRLSGVKKKRIIYAHRLNQSIYLQQHRYKLAF